MRDPIVLAEADDIRAFTRDLWRSEFFRRSHDSGGLVHKTVEQFSGLPRFFFPVTHEAENPHFSAWWGGIQIREYDNPAIHDLYYLHEIWHAGSMVYLPGMEFANFQRKMIDNELEASVVSEMIIYYEIPELRRVTFPYEIFVDRFLFPDGADGDPDPVGLDRWRRNPDLLLASLKLRRRNVMMAQNPNSDDDVEFWIQRYTHQNEMWAHLWYARYDMVEAAMARLIDDCKTIGRKAAIDSFMAWLMSEAVTRGTDIPFPDEAHAFAGVYALNKNLYHTVFEEQNAAQPVSYRAQGS